MSIIVLFVTISESAAEMPGVKECNRYMIRRFCADNMIAHITYENL